MKTSDFDELRAHAIAYAKARDVSVELYKEHVDGSPVSVGGTRIELFVFRRVSGCPPREHPLFHYRVDVADLKARIERDIQAAALKLQAPG